MMATCGIVALAIYVTGIWAVLKGVKSASLSTESAQPVFPNHFGISCNESEFQSIVTDLQDIPYENQGRYLIITRILEQLSKAKFHLADLMYLARLTNRTLVLPKCLNGLLGNGLFANQSLCMYYDLRNIGEYAPWISEEDFLDRIALFKSRNKSRLPSFFKLVLKSSHQICGPDNSAPDFLKPKPSKHNLTMAAFIHSNFLCGDCLNASNFGSIKSLVLDSKVNSAKVLVIRKTNPYKCFPSEAALPYIKYPANFLSTVDQFVKEKLGPRFLSIHWRIEKLSVLGMAFTRERIVKCGRGLIRTAKRLSKKYNLKGVFIASDISPDNKILSNGFKLSRETRMVALSTVQEVHRTLQPAAWADFNENIPKIDSGTLGILDKLVCSKGHVFMYPPSWCFGRENTSYIPSSYTREIVDIRKARGIPSNLSKLWEV